MVRRALIARSVLVRTTIPSVTGVAQAGARLGRPSTSTTQTRQEAQRCSTWKQSIEKWQRVGMRISSFSAASRIVEPASTLTGWSLIFKLTFWLTL